MHSRTSPWSCVCLLGIVSVLKVQTTVLDPPVEELGLSECKEAAVTYRDPQLPAFNVLDNPARFCAQLDLFCVQHIDVTGNRILCLDQVKTLSLKVQNLRFVRTIRPLNPTTPINLTSLTICRTEFQLRSCSIAVYRPNENEHQLIMQVSFKAGSWTENSNGCNCSEFKRLLEAQEELGLKPHVGATRERLPTILATASWPLPFLVAHSFDGAMTILTKIKLKINKKH